jgi:hypothetical protein
MDSLSALESFGRFTVFDVDATSRGASLRLRSLEEINASGGFTAGTLAVGSAAWLNLLQNGMHNR